ncbi:MAG: uracil-DNA glycosylase, partial [Acetobacteraceae bacterium]
RSGMDPLAALRLQLEWGVDEAIEDAPVDRLRSIVSARADTVPKPGLMIALADRNTPVEKAASAARAAGSLAALREAIAAFDGCALRDTAANPVFAGGDPASGLLLIGGPPSADDDRAGQPMTGPAGAYLDRVLDSIGLNRAGLVLSPLIPWRPPGGRPPSANELALCLPFLHQLVCLCRPRLIVLLGPLPANALLGAGSARKRRGKWTDLLLPGETVPIPALPSFDPGTLMNGPARAEARSRSTEMRALADSPALEHSTGGPLHRRDAWADLRSLARMLATHLAAN